MTEPSNRDRLQVPLVARTLIDLLRALHPTALPALVSADEMGTTVLHPPGSTVAEDGGHFELHHLGMAGTAALQLRLVPGAVPGEEVRRLASALAAALVHDHEARAAARELSDRYEEINLLYSISEILGSVRSFTDAAARILAEVSDVLGARRASLWAYRPESAALEILAAVGEDGLTGPIPVEDSESATAWVFRVRQAINVERAPASHFREDRPRRGSPEAFLSVPVHYTPPEGASRTVGVLTLIGRRAGDRFSTGDERLLSAVASQIGAAIEAQRLLEDSLRQERILRELELAHDLQLKLLPDPASFPAPPEIAARCVPAESVGGDFYQLYRLSGDRFGLLIGDVSSHGFAAALIMALTMSAIGIYAKEEEAPAEVLRRVHRALIRELESTEMFLSLFYGVLDSRRGRLDYANAGHPQAYRIDGDRHVARLGATGPPLGTMPIEPYGERVAPWVSGDLLVLFTDGLSDTLASHMGSADGEQSLLQAVLQHLDEPADDIVAHVFRHSDAQPPTASPDDRTLLVVRG